MSGSGRPAEPTVAQRLRDGLRWNVLATLASQAIDLLRVIIVARLLAPEDFGIFAMAMVVLLAIIELGNFGLKDAFIALSQETDIDEDRWLHSVWTGNLGIQALIGGLLAAAAYPASLMYDEPVLFPMLLALAVVPLLRALKNPALMLLEKRIDFARVALFDLVVAIITLVATTILAYLTRSPWALVIGSILAAGLSSAASYWLASMRPRLMFDWAPMKQSLVFGKYLMAMSVMSMLTTQMDNLFIGVQIGAAALGFYTIAYRICEMPKLLLTATASRTIYPYFAETLRNNPAQLSGAWLRSFNYITWLTIAAFLPIILCRDFVIFVLFGPQWSEAAALLVPLGILGILRCMNRSQNPLLLAVKKPELETIAKVVELLLFLPLIYAGYRITGDALGVAWGAAATYVAGTALRLIWSVRILRPGLASLLFESAKPAAAAGLMLAAATAALSLQAHDMIVIVLLGAIWLSCLLVMEPLARQQLRLMVRRRA